MSTRESLASKEKQTSCAMVQLHVRQSAHVTYDMTSVICAHLKESYYSEDWDLTQIHTCGSLAGIQLHEPVVDHMRTRERVTQHAHTHIYI